MADTFDYRVTFQPLNLDGLLYRQWSKVSKVLNSLLSMSSSSVSTVCEIYILILGLIAKDKKVIVLTKSA